MAANSRPVEVIQLTHEPRGHQLFTTQVFSPDDRWIVFDNRPHDTMIGPTPTVGMVDVETGHLTQLYRTTNQTEHGPGVAAASFSPVRNRVMFIHGLRNCDANRPYAITRRTCVAVDLDKPGVPILLDARDVTVLYTRGALRGGTHAHTWSADGQWISFTYNDAVLHELEMNSGQQGLDTRTIGVMVPAGPVAVDEDPEGENNDGQLFSVLVVKVVRHAEPGSDQIEKAFSDGWVGTQGYLKPDGSRQQRAIAFQGHVRDQQGKLHSELYIVDLPGDTNALTIPKPGTRLEGTPITRPAVPAGVVQRRLTYTLDRKFPGLQGPRHWIRSTPDGSRLALLMKDDNGIAQIHTASPNGGEPIQLTRNPWSVQTPFSWRGDGRAICYAADNSVFVTELDNAGRETQTRRLTPRYDDATAPTPTGIVFSNDGNMIAFNRYVSTEGKLHSQIFLIRYLADN